MLMLKITILNQTKSSTLNIAMVSILQYWWFLINYACVNHSGLSFDYGWRTAWLRIVALNNWKAHLGSSVQELLKRRKWEPTRRGSTSPGLEGQKPEGKKHLFNRCVDKTEQQLQNIMCNKLTKYQLMTVCNKTLSKTSTTVNITAPGCLSWNIGKSCSSFRDWPH